MSTIQTNISDGCEVVFSISSPPEIAVDISPAAVQFSFDIGTVTYGAIPPNYGLITYDGSTITVS